MSDMTNNPLQTQVSGSHYKDLKKARHFLDILIDLETRDAGT